MNSVRNQCEPKTICNLNGMKMEKTLLLYILYESGLTSANAIQTPSTAFLADSVPIKNRLAPSVIILQHQAKN